jgi:HK97 family phage major capsid protein
MSLKEQLAEKKSALKALEENIKAGEEEAIAEGEEISAAIAEIEKAIESAEKANELLAQIGNAEEPQEDEVMNEEKGLKSMDLASLKTARGSKSIYLKSASDPEAMGNNKIIDYDQNVVDAHANLGVRGLFGAEAISGNALTYYTLGTLEGTIAGVNEGAKKPQVHVPYDAVTVALQKIAAYYKDTDELLSDAPFLATSIQNRGVYEFNKAVEAYLVNTVLNASGIVSGPTSVDFDSILTLKQMIAASTGYIPDAMIINPADWATLLQTKDGAGGTSGQYLLGGPAFGAYGNGDYFANPKVWGLNVIESSAITQGSVIVGAFKAGGSVVTKAGEGFRLEVSNSNEDDFIYNRVTVRLEERMVLAVRVPGAFGVIAASH